MAKSNSPNFELPLFAGVDVGGTNIKVGLVDSLGNIVASTKFPTQQELGPEHAIAETRSVFDQLLAELPFSWENIAAAGLGTPGPMDIVSGMILTPSNLPAWHDFPARDSLKPRNHSQQSGLSAPGRPDDRNKFSAVTV